MWNFLGLGKSTSNSQASRSPYRHKSGAASDSALDKYARQPAGRSSSDLSRRPSFSKSSKREANPVPAAPQAPPQQAFPMYGHPARQVPPTGNYGTWGPTSPQEGPLPQGYTRRRAQSLTYEKAPGPGPFPTLRSRREPPTLRPNGSGHTVSRQRTQVIKFYERDEPYYEFTNFAAVEVRYQKKIYPTSEHLFQAWKFLEHRPNLAEHIRTCGDRPGIAFSEARRFAPEVRPDWLDINIQVMDEVVGLKFSQHPSLMRVLIDTRDAYLVEDAGSNDAFWGNGGDGKGHNHLGRALMRLRGRNGGFGEVRL